MFVDEVKITIKAGKGGDGCLSFRREKYVPKGGPDGGNGGHGGSVIIKADRNTSSLLEQRKAQQYKAGKGQPGMGGSKQGSQGDDCIILVPVGTVVKNLDKNKIVADLVEDEQEVIAAKGGKGGRGNKSFATAINQTPREFEYGTEGEDFEIHLEIKLIADVGLIGLPNAGKSTILSRLSAATPKIANYPFTTLKPQLGLVDMGDHRSFVMADIPGLIEGAHEGAGLGTEFLKHIERTTCLAHIIDLMPYDGSDPVNNFKIIENEIKSFSDSLAAKKRILVGNKSDLPGSEESAERLEQETGLPVVKISAVTGKNLDIFKSKCYDMVKDV